MNAQAPISDPEQLPIENQRWCEKCGYRVDGISDDSPCPECGRGVGLSDPANRVGSAWQRNPSITGWVRSSFSLLRCPRAFWDRVVVDRRAARRLALVNALLAAVIGVGIPTFVLRDPMLFAMLTPLAAVTVWTLTVVEYTGLRLWGRVHGARITRDVSWTVCGHATIGWVIGGVLASAGWILGAFDTVSAAYRVFGAGRVAAVTALASPAMVGIGAVIGLLLFELLTYLGVRRMRFANRPAPSDQPASAGSGAAVSR